MLRILTLSIFLLSTSASAHESTQTTIECCPTTRTDLSCCSGDTETTTATESKQPMRLLDKNSVLFGTLFGGGAALGGSYIFKLISSLPIDRQSKYFLMASAGALCSTALFSLSHFAGEKATEKLTQLKEGVDESVDPCLAPSYFSQYYSTSFIIAYLTVIAGGALGYNYVRI